MKSFLTESVTKYTLTFVVFMVYNGNYNSIVKTVISNQLILAQSKALLLVAGQSTDKLVTVTAEQLAVFRASCQLHVVAWLPNDQEKS